VPGTGSVGCSTSTTSWEPKLGDVEAIEYVVRAPDLSAGWTV